jgi:hypothetical protein
MGVGEVVPWVRNAVERLTEAASEFGYRSRFCGWAGTGTWAGLAGRALWSSQGPERGGGVAAFWRKDCEL